MKRPLPTTVATAVVALALLLATTTFLLVGLDRTPWAAPGSAITEKHSAARLSDSLPSRNLELPPAPVIAAPAVHEPVLKGIAPAEQASIWNALSAARHGIETIDEADSALPLNQGARLFAQNPGNEFTTRFLDDGIRLASGRGDQEWQAEARVLGLPAPTEIAYDGSRVEYTRGHVIEWYDNRPDGLQQGFIVKHPAAPADGTLRVDVALSGVEAYTAGDDVLHLADGSGTDLLAYSGLVAWDARGQRLPARMEPTAEGIALLVSAQGAQFPVTIDPVFTTLQQKISDNVIGDGASNDEFGASVAISGNTAVVGVPEDDTAAGNEAGSVYVFALNGSVWLRQAKLTASDAASNDELGTSVAIEGDTVIVGAPEDDNTGGGNAGSAYVFNRTPRTTTWTQTQKLLANDAAANDAFGTSVSLSGNTAAVGSPDDDNSGGGNAGSAYVFFRTTGIPNPWSQQGKLTANDGAADDEFGISVAVSANTVVVGAPEDDHSAGGDAGSAYVFFRSGIVWSQQAKLTGLDSAGGDRFGTSVAIHGETALVGAPEDNSASASDSGSAYAFLRTKGVWAQQSKLVIPTSDSGDEFGTSVAILGNTAVIGSPEYDDGLDTNQGNAYVFVRSSGVWSLQDDLLNSANSNSRFGTSVAISGSRIIVGSPSDDNSGVSDAGRAYIFSFSRTTSRWDQSATLESGSSELGSEAGTSVAVSGNTLIVGSPIDDSSAGTDAGRAFALVRLGTSWFFESELANNSANSNDYFGSSVAVSGSIAVIGVPGDDTSAGTDAGSARVFTRSSRTKQWSGPIELNRTDLAPNGGFGTSVAIAGTTALVGAPYDNTSAGNKAGSVYVFARNRDGVSWSRLTRLTASDAAAEDFFGYAVAFQGSTALVGAPGDDTPAGAGAGSAYAFLRSKLNWIEQPKLVADDGAAGDGFGSAVSLFSNTALIGAPTEDNNGGTDAGSAYVMIRTKGVWSQQAKLTASDGATQDRFGTAVAVSADTALVGSPLDDTPAGSDVGSVHCFTKLKGTTTWPSSPKLTPSGAPTAGDKFGASISLSGNTAVVGAPWDDTDSGNNAGSIHVFVP